MSCIDCINNCGDHQTSDKCVTYTGEDIPLLGIKKGDTLWEWEQAVVAKLTEAVSGSDIILSDITLNCTFLTAAFGGKDKNLTNLLQLLLDNQCTLRSLIPTIVSATFNTECLSGLSPTATRDQILQAVIDKLCIYVGKVDTIAGDYVKATELNNLIKQYLNSTSGTGVVQEYTKLPKYVALPYHGPLSNFDSSGKGLLATGYDKLFICNGSNGTPDYRGRSPIGANLGVQGVLGLNSAVNPIITGVAITPGLAVGEYKHVLTADEGAPHTHLATDPGHTHYSFGNVDGDSGDVSSNTVPNRSAGRGGNSSYSIQGSANIASVGKTSLAKTGITITSAGNGAAHNNIQPSLGCVFIMYIP